VDWFNLAFLWYLQTTIDTLFLAPLGFWLLRHLTDRGAGMVRPVACLLFIWPVWFLSGIGPGLVPFNRTTLWITIAVLGIAGWALAIRVQLIDRLTIQHLVIAEVGFLACFAAFTWFHGYGPDITSQEKSSDLMMLSSAMRAESMPPPDAWFSGNSVNYYYLGYVIFGSFGRMIGAAPAETFNLALATIFGMTVVTAAGLAGNIIGKWSALLLARIGGLLAVGFIVLSGNPWAAFTWLGDRSGQWNNSFFQGGLGWDSTRLLPSGVDYPAISEFPAFSFVLADLHPHLMALPFAITALGIAWMLATLPGTELVRVHWPRLIAAGGIIGAMYALNAWDFPTYLAVGLLALIWGSTALVGRERITALAIVVLSSLICWLPFYVNFEAPTRQGSSAAAEKLAGIPVVGSLLASIAGYTGDRSSFGDYFSVFGFAWTIAIVFIASEFYQRRDEEHDRQMQNLLIAAGVVLTIVGLIAPVALLIVCGLPIIAICLLFERDSRLTLPNVTLGLFGIGFALTLIPEFFFLLDVFGSRMNTVFKVYYQVWLLIGLGSALAIVVLVQSYRSVPIARYLVATGAAVTIALGIVYPIVGGNQWLNWRNPQHEWVGIDGLAFLEQQDPGEYAAIDWLRDNGTTDDVILAAGGCDWVDQMGRASAGSGVPMLIGWYGHEWQWHLGDQAQIDELVARASAIPELYDTLSPELLDKYGITLLYIGDVEESGVMTSEGLKETTQSCAPGPFPNASNADFPGAGWTEAFNQDGVRIYRRDGT
jgi:YYY domain-containing protein